MEFRSYEQELVDKQTSQLTLEIKEMAPIYQEVLLIQFSQATVKFKWQFQDKGNLPPNISD